MITGVATRDAIQPPVGGLAENGVHPCFFSDLHAGAGYVVRFASSRRRRTGSTSRTVNSAYARRLDRESKGISICKVLHTWFNPGLTVFLSIFMFNVIKDNSVYFSALSEREKSGMELGLAPCLRHSTVQANGRHSKGFAQIGGFASAPAQAMRRQQWTAVATTDPV